MSLLRISPAGSARHRPGRLLPTEEPWLPGGGAVIGLVGLHPEGHCGWVASLPHLPRPPAFEYTAFLVDCASLVPIASLIEWSVQARSRRPGLPIGVVVGKREAELAAVIRFTARLAPVIEETKILGRRVCVEVLTELREAAIEGRILEVLRAHLPLDDPDALSLCAAAVAVGVNGGRVAELTRVLPNARASVYRRFVDAGLPPPGQLLARARMMSVEISVELGVDPAVARRAAGWSSADTYRRFRARRSHI